MKPHIGQLMCEHIAIIWLVFVQWWPIHLEMDNSLDIVYNYSVVVF